VTDIRRCACAPACRFPAAPGSKYYALHDPAPERRSERSARMREVRAGRGDMFDWSAYRARPVELLQDVFGFTPWERQAELLRAIAEHDRVSYAAAHKVGKSEAMAGAAWWWPTTRPNARVVITAPTARQIRSVVWRAVMAFFRRAKVPIVCEVNDRPELGVQFANGNEIIGFSSDEAERFAGISGENLLFVVDEASGISAEIFEAIMGSAAGGAKVVLVGNPTKTAGPFYDSHHDSAAHWHRGTISSEESPNVIAGERIIPGLATRQWLEERRDDWGAESPLYAIRVLGQWPRQSAHAVVGMDAVDVAIRRDCRQAFKLSDAPLVLGVDVARFGSDESVVFAARGLSTLPPFVFRGLDTVALAFRVRAIAHELARPNERVKVNVDESGVGGGVVDQLRRFDDLDVNGINAGESAGNPQYMRRRDELWFSIANYLKRGGTLPDDRKLIGELVAVEYSFSPNGKIQVEAKDELRKRLGRSPDRADALALAVYVPDDDYRMERYCAAVKDAHAAVVHGWRKPAPQPEPPAPVAAPATILDLVKFPDSERKDEPK
jgi:phage terminase large subunit